MPGNLIREVVFVFIKTLARVAMPREAGMARLLVSMLGSKYASQVGLLRDIGVAQL